VQSDSSDSNPEETMKRAYLPLLPLPVLAAIVAASACSKARTEETTNVIPPAVILPAPAAEAKKPVPEAALAARSEDEKPTAQDLKEFERPVRK
jgi:hypothetical protein